MTKKKKLGRPTKYRESMIDQVPKYIESCQDEFDYNTKTTDVNLPTICGFALFIGTTEKNIHEWAGKYPNFRESLDLIKTHQKHRLQNGSLSNKYNPTIAKLILSHNHGMTEKQEIDHTTNGKDLSPIFLAGHEE